MRRGPVEGEGEVGEDGGKDCCVVVVPADFVDRAADVTAVAIGGIAVEFLSGEVRKGEVVIIQARGKQSGPSGHKEKEETERK